MTDPLDRPMTFRDRIALDDWQWRDRLVCDPDPRSTRQWLIDRASQRERDQAREAQGEGEEAMSSPSTRHPTFADMADFSDWQRREKGHRVGDHRSDWQWWIDRASESASAGTTSGGTPASTAPASTDGSSTRAAPAPASAPSAGGTGSGGGSSAAELFRRLREALAEERWNLPDADYQTSDCRFVMDTRLAVDALLAAHEAGDVGDIVALNANHAAALEAMTKRAAGYKAIADSLGDMCNRFESRATAAEAKCKELERQLDEERALTLEIRGCLLTDAAASKCPLCWVDPMPTRMHMVREAKAWQSAFDARRRAEREQNNQAGIPAESRSDVQDDQVDAVVHPGGDARGRPTEVDPRDVSPSPSEEDRRIAREWWQHPTPVNAPEHYHKDSLATLLARIRADERRKGEEYRAAREAELLEWEKIATDHGVMPAPTEMAGFVSGLMDERRELLGYVEIIGRRAKWIADSVHDMEPITSCDSITAGICRRAARLVQKHGGAT